MSGLQGISQGALGLCANLAMWGMLLVAIPLVSEGKLLPPQLAMLALFALASFEAVMPLPLAFQTLGETLAAARRIFSLADMPPAVTEPEQPLPVPETLHFAFRDVDFRYQPEGTDVLHNISLDLPPRTSWPSLGLPGRAKVPLPACCCVFANLPVAKSCWMGSRFSSITVKFYANTLQSYRSKPIYSTPPCVKICC